MADPVIVEADLEPGAGSAGFIGTGTNGEAVAGGLCGYLADGLLMVGGLDVAAEGVIEGITLTGAGSGGQNTWIKNGGVFHSSSAIFTEGAYYWLGAAGIISETKPASGKNLTGLGIATSTKDLDVQIRVLGQMS